MFGQFLRKVLSEEELIKKQNRKSYAESFLEVKSLKKPTISPKRLVRKGMANDKIDPKITAWLNA